MVEDAAGDAVRRWREFAEDGVVLDGFHALKHALRFGADVRVVCTSDKEAVLRLAAGLAGDVTERLCSLAVEIPAPALRTLVPRVHPTGVAALAVRRGAGENLAALTSVPRHAPVVVLDNPRHLGNVGAVVRVAAGFGATGVVTTGEVDPWHPTVVRAAAGLHYATAVERLALPELPPGPLYVLDPDGSDIRSIAFPDDTVLAFGSERQGVSPELRSRATALVSIPMRPLVSSFNLATTVGMALFHWMAGRDDLRAVDKSGKD
jgi:RNA methyltransferase, TrmH family